MKFKAGDLVTCIDNEDYQDSLKLNKDYIVTRGFMSNDREHVELVGVVGNRKASRFVLNKSRIVTNILNDL